MENKLESPSHGAPTSLKVEKPQFIMIESPDNSPKMTVRVLKTQRIPKAIPGDMMEQLELIEGDTSKWFLSEMSSRNP